MPQCTRYMHINCMIDAVYSLCMHKISIIESGKASRNGHGFINAPRACARVTVLCVCVCVSAVYRLLTKFIL